VATAGFLTACAPRPRFDQDWDYEKKCFKDEWATTLTLGAGSLQGIWHPQATTDDGVCTIDVEMTIGFDAPPEHMQPDDNISGSFRMKVRFNGTPTAGVSHHLEQWFTVFDGSDRPLFTLGQYKSVDLPDNDFHEWSETIEYPAKYFRGMKKVCRRPCSGS
jgi:hypothetical protein